MKTKSPCKEILLQAVEEATVSRGPKKGYLKKTCPPSHTLGAAAWQALQNNPYKISVGVCFMFSGEQKAVFDFLSENGILGKDQDREVLTQLGAW